MSGQLWVVEGGDGVGKSTQARELVTRLNESKLLGDKTAHYWHFPNYQAKPWGETVTQYLKGRFGSVNEVSPYFAAILYSADQGQSASEIQSILNSGDWIIADRYYPSNLAHQSAKLDDKTERDKFLAWLIQLNYHLGIVEPNGIIYLNLPAEISLKRMQSRREAAQAQLFKTKDQVNQIDIHEQDDRYATRVLEEYNHLADKFKWNMVLCAEGNKQLTAKHIAQKVWEIVSPKLKG